MHVRRILTLYKPNMFCACGSIAYIIIEHKFDKTFFTAF
nr:MAG TPA: hypothetical protein [Caudoviricetes sp.]